MSGSTGQVAVHRGRGRGKGTCWLTVQVAREDYDRALADARAAGVMISEWVSAALRYAGEAAKSADVVRRMSAEIEQLQAALEDARRREKRLEQECDTLRREVDLQVRLLVRSRHGDDHKLFSVPEFAARRAVEWAESKAAQLMSLSDIVRDNRRKIELMREARVVMTEADIFRAIAQAYEQSGTEADRGIREVSGADGHRSTV